MISRILVPIDHSEHSRRAVTFAADLAVGFGASVRFLHVLTKVLGRQQLTRYADLLGTTPEADASELAEIREKLAASGEVEGLELLEQARSHAVHAGVSEVETTLDDGDPATVILHQVFLGQHDVVVLGRRGMGNLKGLLAGSVSQKVAAWGRCTVILVK